MFQGTNVPSTLITIVPKSLKHSLKTCPICTSPSNFGYKYKHPSLYPSPTLTFPPVKVEEFPAGRIPNPDACAMCQLYDLPEMAVMSILDHMLLFFTRHVLPNANLQQLGFYRLVGHMQFLEPITRFPGNVKGSFWIKTRRMWGLQLQHS